MLFGAIISVIGFLTLDKMVRFLGSTETIAPYARTYITYILIAAPFMTSSLTMNNILRYEGKAKLGMKGLMAGAILNMAGDPILMFVLKMGIAGAGLSTALSQLVSWGILLSMFLHGKTESEIKIKSTDFSKVWNIMSTGFPSMLRQGLNSLTTVMLNAQCATYGDAAIAAMSIVSRIIFFAFSIALGVGQGFQPVAGYNYGAKKYSRVRQGYQFTVIAAECIIIVMSVLLIALSGKLIGAFRDDPDVILIGTRALRLQTVATLFLPPCMATEMLYQSTGRKLGATVLSAVRSGLLFIPSLLILASVRGLAGIQEAQPLSQILSFPAAIWFAIAFFRKLPKEQT